MNNLEYYKYRYATNDLTEKGKNTLIELLIKETDQLYKLLEELGQNINE